MNSFFSRTELLIGGEALNKLKNSKVAIFGLGGVGGYVFEALLRSGVGSLVLVDNDTVDITNINRQILATNETIGKAKVEVAKARAYAINPDCHVETHKVFVLPETIDGFDFSEYDYIVDAIDTVSGKLAIISAAKSSCKPVISSMGTGNKLDPTLFAVADIFDTDSDPLARVMRRELRKRGINKLKCVYSKEKPIGSNGASTEGSPRRSVPGSISFVPSAAGLIIASEVIKDIITL